jgi:hypothetical protein
MSDYLPDVENEEGATAAPVIDIENSINIEGLKSLIKDYLTNYEPKFERRNELISQIVRQREVEPDTLGRDSDGRLKTVPPVTASAVNIAYGHVKNYINQLSPFFDTQALGQSPDSRKKAKIAQKYLNLLADSRTDLNIRVKNNTIIYDCVSLGGKFVKVIWDDDVYRTKVKMEDGTTVEQEYRRHFGPSIVPVDTRNVIYPNGYENITEMPFIAVKTVISKIEYKRLWVDGTIKNYVFDGEEGDAVYTEPADAEVSQEIQDENERRGYQFTTEDMTDFWEFYLYYELLDEKGEPTQMIGDYVVWYAAGDDKILRVSPNTLGERPITCIPYIIMPGNVDGKGVGHYTMGAQNDAEFWSNVRQQNARFAVNKSFWARLGSVNPKIRVQPGGVYYYNSQDEIPQEMRVSEVPGSSFEQERMSRQDAQTGSGISSIMGGMADPTLKSRDTFSGQNFRFKQSMGVIGALIENMENGFASVANLVWKWLVLKNKEVIEYETLVGRLDPADIAELELALNMDVENVPVTLQFSIKTTNLDQTQEAVRQNYLLVSQLNEQYFQSLTPVFQALSNPQIQQMPELMMFFTQMIVSKTKLQQQILDGLDLSDTELLLPNVERQVAQIQAANEQISQMISQLKNSGGGGVNGTGTIEGQAEPAGTIPNNPGATGGVPGGQGSVPTMQGQSGVQGI